MGLYVPGDALSDFLGFLPGILGRTGRSKLNVGNTLPDV